ncbi:MAG: hypothetical protein CL708_02245 [Chloroflexi bacterium]|jgi:quercetin dioxygenase-like cupin family protein|nr:hypothetical protein [Chloroflexota bacterium]|tara:strand:- start:51 stop:392 length:342 start_codon:yes stop_codon:yes gene_type:complete
MTEYKKLTNLEGNQINGDLYLKIQEEANHMSAIKMKLTTGSETPLHTHEHESLGVIISGKLDVIGDGKSSILGPGDTWVNPIGQKHMIKAIEDTVFVEIKSPSPDFSSFLKLD